LPQKLGQSSTHARGTYACNAVLKASHYDSGDESDAHRLQYFLLRFIMDSEPGTDISGVEEILRSPVCSTATHL
jgi:hypothetical protein